MRPPLNTEPGKYDDGIRRRIGIILCIAGPLMWGTIGIFVKKISGLTPIGMACSRLLLSFIAILPWVLCRKYRREELLSSFRSVRSYAMLSLIMSVHFIFSIKGFHATTVANASILNNTTPIFVPLVAFLLLKEITLDREWVGIGIAFAGILCIFSVHQISFSSHHFQGNAYATLSAVLLAVYTVIAKKLRQRYSPWTTMAWVFGLGGVFIVCEGLIVNDPFFQNPTLSDVGYVLGLSLIATFLGHLAYNAGLKYLKSSIAGSLTLASPLSATCYAAILLSEIPTSLSLLGLALTVGGIIMVVVEKSNKGATST